MKTKSVKVPPVSTPTTERGRSVEWDMVLNATEATALSPPFNEYDLATMDAGNYPVPHRSAIRFFLPPTEIRPIS